MAREKLEQGSIFSFNDVGDKITGKVTGFRKITTRNGTSPVCDLVDSRGMAQTIFLSTMLEGLLSQVNTGDVIEVVFTGFGQTTSGYQMKEYEVFRLTGPEASEYQSGRPRAPEAEEDEIPF